MALAALVTVLDGQKLYKVLSPTGESQNGGTMKWSLPSEDQPGEWHETERAVMCSEGLHLTTAPAEWWRAGCRVFEVEASDFALCRGTIERQRDKVVARRARLVRELTIDELVGVGIIRTGCHEVREGSVIVEGSASVTAYGSASVTAYGSASVRAEGHVLVGTWPQMWGTNLAKVELAKDAVHVDYRKGTPTVSTGRARCRPQVSGRVTGSPRSR